jgi:hypothetical protein
LADSAFGEVFAFSRRKLRKSIRFYGVKVSIEDFESFDPGSIPGKTFFIPNYPQFIFKEVRLALLWLSN